VKTRDDRLKAISKTIVSHAVASQEELLRLLTEQGHEVTQATLSRDLKVLRVGKVSSPHGGYIYSLPEESNRNLEELVRDFQRGYLSMESSQNLVVLKTLPGHAQSVAWAMDNLELPSVLGTVAGDDTILLILRAGKTFDALQQNLAKLIPDWEA
jgi:transcriptional regulator of arginine metabolism